MQYLSVALPLAALASGALAGPWGGACASNACLEAVTGKGALGDDHLRGGHCASFLATTVTPEAVTVTTTITGDGSNNWKRAKVTVCPNEVPNYASACNTDAYSSACSCFGFTEVKTTTLAPTTTTKTVYVKPTGGAGCATATVTATVVSGTTCPAAPTKTVTVASGTTCAAASTTTVTVGGATASTVTVTATVTESGHSYPSGSSVPSKCNVDDALATTLVNNFMDLLSFTSYNGTQGPPGHGYHQNVSDATLATDFVDISDSINFMAGIPLGSITFPNKAAFDFGQGTQQPEVSISALNIWHDCNTITWRWRLFPPTRPNSYPVTGINHMIINDDLKIQKNYAEFDNGAWLQSFGLSCAPPTSPVSVASSPALKARKIRV